MAAVNILQIVSQDGHIVEVKEPIARFSEVIADLLDNTGGNDQGNQKVPVNVFEKTLRSAFEWVGHHQDDNDKVVNFDKQPEKLASFRDDPLEAWDQDFFGKLNNKELCELLMAADVLNIHYLLWNAAKVLAGRIDSLDSVEMGRVLGEIN